MKLWPDHQKFTSLFCEICYLTLIKKFVQLNHPNEFADHEMYKDWDRCSITVNKVNNWVQNVKASGRINVPRQSDSIKYQTKMKAENLLKAKTEIDKIKNDCKNKDMEFKLTGKKLASIMGIHCTTAHKYLKILEDT